MHGLVLTQQVCHRVAIVRPDPTVRDLHLPSVATSAAAPSSFPTAGQRMGVDGAKRPPCVLEL